ncbi:9877_t:CDS:2 [Ambispora leptoticha]|uniref:9877_t:CDS:1 n=1 Tax=Ambispora leptoticha TaxID=144679 RepID=A0A9N8WEC3_9GLOM|nr:9877_t:CDS:2 [Ambispora leptoticha]
MQKIEKADYDFKPDQAINKLLIQEIRKDFKAYIKKLDEEYDSDNRNQLQVSNWYTSNIIEFGL